MSYESIWGGKIVKTVLFPVWTFYASADRKSESKPWREFPYFYNEKGVLVVSEHIFSLNVWTSILWIFWRNSLLKCKRSIWLMKTPDLIKKTYLENLVNYLYKTWLFFKFTCKSWSWSLVITHPAIQKTLSLKTVGFASICIAQWNAV